MAETAKDSGIALEKAYQIRLWLTPKVKKGKGSEKFLVGNLASVHPETVSFWNSWLNRGF